MTLRVNTILGRIAVHVELQVHLGMVGMHRSRAEAWCLLKLLPAQRDEGLDCTSRMQGCWLHRCRRQWRR